MEESGARNAGNTPTHLLVLHSVPCNSAVPICHPPMDIITQSPSQVSSLTKPDRGSGLRGMRFHDPPGGMRRGSQRSALGASSSALATGFDCSRCWIEMGSIIGDRRRRRSGSSLRRRVALDLLFFLAPWMQNEILHTLDRMVEKTTEGISIHV